MPYRVGWYKKPRIIRVDFYGHLSLDDYEYSDRAVMRMLQNQSEKAYVVMDMGKVGSFPMSLYQIRIRLNSWRLPNYGGAIAFETKPIMNVMIRSLNRLLGAPYLYARDLDAALSIIKQIDPSTRPLLTFVETQELPALVMLNRSSGGDSILARREAAEVHAKKYSEHLKENHLFSLEDTQENRPEALDKVLEKIQKERPSIILPKNGNHRRKKKISKKIAPKKPGWYAMV